MFNLIQKDLEAVYKNIDKEYFLKAGHLTNFVSDCELENLDKFLLPAMVILPARLLKGCAQKMLVLAGVVQFILVAQVIHNRITDDCPKEVPQFPVLVGDYLFSKFFKYLSDNDLLDCLAPLAKVICEMNEGGIVRLEHLEKGQGSAEDFLRVIKQEHGLLTAQACRIGGHVARAHNEILDSLEQFGLNLGTAWGIIKEKLPLSPMEFLEKAQVQLKKLPAGPERDTMCALVNWMADLVPTNLKNRDGSCVSF